MHGTHIFIPVDAEIFWQQMRTIVEEVLHRRNMELIEKSANQQSQLLKVKDVCLLFKISKPTIYEWIRKGQLKSVKIESRRYFLRSDIENLITNSKA